MILSIRHWFRQYNHDYFCQYRNDFVVNMVDSTSRPPLARSPISTKSCVYMHLSIWQSVTNSMCTQQLVQTTYISFSRGTGKSAVFVCVKDAMSYIINRLYDHRPQGEQVIPHSFYYAYIFKG